MSVQLYSYHIAIFSDYQGGIALIVRSDWTDLSTTRQPEVHCRLRKMENPINSGL